MPRSAGEIENESPSDHSDHNERISPGIDRYGDVDIVIAMGTAADSQAIIWICQGEDFAAGCLKIIRTATIPD